MRKGQKLSKATTRSQQLQVRKNNRQSYQRERQRIQGNKQTDTRKPTRSYSSRRSASLNNVVYKSPDAIDRFLEGIVDFIWNSIKKIFQKIFS